MIWAGTSIPFWGLPLRGHRLGRRWLDNDESLYWNYDEDDSYGEEA